MKHKRLVNAVKCDETVQRRQASSTTGILKFKIKMFSPLGAASQEGQEKLGKAGEGWDHLQLSDCRNGCCLILVFASFCFKLPCEPFRVNLVGHHTFSEWKILCPTFGLDNGGGEENCKAQGQNTLARLTIELTATDYPVGIVMMDRINDMSYTSEPTEQEGFGREGTQGN